MEYFPFIFYYSGVMVSVLTSSAVDLRFKSRSCQTKDLKMYFCCFSAKHAAFMSKNKDRLAWNRDNVDECSNMSVHRLV